MSRRRAAVITVSDRCAAHVSSDRSGPLVASRLGSLPAEVVAPIIIADDIDLIRHTVLDLATANHLVVLSGGTGLGPRDVTPQALAPLLDYEVPGMAEAMRTHGAASTAHAMLSRQVAGVIGRCLVLALPGSPRAVSDCLDAVWNVLPHALDVLTGAGDGHPEFAARD